MSALDDLHSAVRIARSASAILGVSNTRRFARANSAIAAVRRLVDSVDSALSFGLSETAAARDLREAIKPFRQEVGK